MVECGTKTERQRRRRRRSFGRRHPRGRSDGRTTNMPRSLRRRLRPRRPHRLRSRPHPCFVASSSPPFPLRLAGPPTSKTDTATGRLPAAKCADAGAAAAPASGCVRGSLPTLPRRRPQLPRRRPHRACPTMGCLWTWSSTSIFSPPCVDPVVPWSAAPPSGAPFADCTTFSAMPRSQIRPRTGLGSCFASHRRQSDNASSIESAAPSLARASTNAPTSTQLTEQKMVPFWTDNWNPVDTLIASVIVSAFRDNKAIQHAILQLIHRSMVKVPLGHNLPITAKRMEPRSLVVLASIAWMNLT